MPNFDSDWSLDVIRERVTADAVHRRFSKSEETDEKEYYFCEHCNQKLSASGKEPLKSHFESKKHEPSDSCVHCSKPVYSYMYKKKVEKYHECKK